MQEKEDEKVFNFLQNFESHGIHNYLSLTVRYKNNTQVYDIGIHSAKSDIYHKLEDLKKARVLIQDKVIKYNKELEK
ncbi:hypothetical protein A4R27_08835 [Priestia endophytica]|nr:hypothetical protein A4R27_08835 [Priestia endophytica]